MEDFLQFLQRAKKALEQLESIESFHLVLGNESCDLDSTVSALALAYLIHSQSNEDCTVIPIMNTEFRYFHLRTATSYVLKQVGIDPSLLVFKEQVKFSQIMRRAQISTTVVDHHVLSRKDRFLQHTIVQIFDHRPINEVEICGNENTKRTIQLVGSCATLVTFEIINSALPILFNELSYLLYATIVFDTIGLDHDCGRTTNDDIRAAEHLEKIIQLEQTRKELFQVLWDIHKDTSGLNTKDLLYRDLKVVKKVPVPGLPMLVQQYFNRADSEAAIHTFACELGTEIVVLIGIDASDEVVRRDVAIFSTNPLLTKPLLKVFRKKGEALALVKVPVKNSDVICFEQGNIKLTRKFILPLVDEAASHFYCHK